MSNDSLPSILAELCSAISAVEAAAPSARDYRYLGTGAWRRARSEHAARLARLLETLDAVRDGK